MFSPRIPMEIMKGEDTSIKRICTSTTLEGCLGSAPWGGSLLLNLNENVIFKVYKFDINDIEEGNLITAKELYEKALVDDALLYNEHWIVNQDIKPCEVFYIKIDSIVDSINPLIPHKWLEDYKNADLENAHEYIKSEKTVFYDLKCRLVDRDELLFGNVFEFSIKKLKNIGEYELAKEHLVELVQQYSTTGDCDDIIDYEEDDLLVIETPMSSLGLWHEKLMEELKQLYN